MISPQCQEALDLLRRWRTEMETSEEAFDLERSRASFKLFPRPLHVLQERTFWANGAQYEWICDTDADPDLRMLYLHGGGYISGDLDTTEPFSKLISHVTGCSVLAIEYRLAPEHPFPHALHDALNAIRWLRSNGPQGRGTARRIFIAGDSSGGGLTLSTLLKLRDDGHMLPDGAVTLSAFTDLSLSGQSLNSRAEVDPVLHVKLLEFCSRAYASGVSTTEPYVSPLFAESTGLPPLFMQVGGKEILLDDTLRFAEKARSSGVQVTLDVWPEMFHSWQMLAPTVPEAQKALDRIGGFVRRFCSCEQPLRSGE